MNNLNRYEKGIENITKLSGEQSTFHEVKRILKDISPRLSDLLLVLLLEMCIPAKN